MLPLWLGRGNVLYDLKRYDEAFAAYDKALALKPDLAEAWVGRGHVLYDLKRYDEAFAAYDKALALKPDFAEAWLGRMLGDGRVLVIAAPAHVRGDPFSLEEDLDRPRGQTCINFGAGEAMRDAVIMGGNLDVIIDADATDGFSVDAGVP